VWVCASLKKINFLPIEKGRRRRKEERRREKGVSMCRKRG
jgi:hypothetical protein